MDSIDAERGDIDRLMKRIEKHTNGLRQSKGYTIGQLLTAYFEGTCTEALRKEWRRYSSKCSDPPPLEMFMEFLKEQLKTASSTKVVIKGEAIPPAKSKPIRSPAPASKPSSKSVFRVQGQRQCAYCQGGHSTFSCPSFREKTATQRREWVKERKLCFNCLGEKHKAEDCKSTHTCHECKRRHNTLLHLPSQSHSHSPAESSSVVNSVHTVEAKYVLPVTAIVNVMSGGLEQQARALFDTGAAMSLISKSLATTLNAKCISNSSISITSVTGTSKTLYQVELTLAGDERVGCQDGRVHLRAHVVDHIAPSTSTADVQKILAMPFLKGLPLADPSYTSSAAIHLILDVGTFFVYRRGETRISSVPSLNADKTIFGWIVGGSDTSPSQLNQSAPTCYKVSSTEEDLNLLLPNLWTPDQFPDDSPPISMENQQVCAKFQETHHRIEEGRYEVFVPWQECAPRLGPSRNIALKRYRSSERSLRRQGRWDEYHAAVEDFIRQGHAELVPDEDLKKPPHLSYYMPMHGVIKSTSTSTKLRPVCDTSAKSESGVSLNDMLLTGASLYPPLTSIINQFRLPAIAMTADVAKMYRQISLAPADRDYHRFVHCDSGGELRDYRMTRVTFGVKSSPYLASQVLQQIAQDYEHEHPEAAKIVKRSFYVDDVLTGAETVEAAQHARKDLSTMLSRGCFPLCKWRSNSQVLLDTIPEELKEATDLRIVSASTDYQKALGIHWSTTQDCLFVATPKVQIGDTVTKRLIASNVAKIFDPMGWFAPAILPARVMVQEAWNLQLGWDDILPDQLFQRWKAWASTVLCINEPPIPCHLGLSNRVVQSRQLHRFSDASKAAYGGVVYLRTLYSTLEVTVDIIAAKARVAPLKDMTVPHLELNGAVTLSRLLDITATDLGIEKSSVYAWSDSAVALGCINQPPSRLTVYVGNRVAKIASLVDASHWRYVNTSQNPADLLSRGVSPDTMSSAKLWWKGPEWLSLEPARWPRWPDINLSRELPQLRTTVLQIIAPKEEIGHTVSRYTRLIRITAWILKFAANSRNSSLRKPIRALSLAELAAAKLLLLRRSQQHFHEDAYNTLSQGKSLPQHHPLLSLTPFIDVDGLIRVGGRLQNADLPESAIHPIILTTKSHTVCLLVEHTHRTMMHVGSSAVMASLSFSFHIPRLKPLLRSISRKCVTCQKHFARPAKQIMGELPAIRSTPSSPFSIVGIDYAGPVLTKLGKPRSYSRVKTCLCLFVCMSTRAVHIEAVQDATTASFLAALTRFVSQRSLPSQIHSDNGSNFMGANAELKRTLEQLRSEESREEVVQWAAQRDVEWIFTPARAPHFGGLWESAVKSMKHLLKKTLGPQILSFEELSTMAAAAAEAILNSRPLLPIHSTSDEAICPLTPGHFLVGRPLVSLPQRVDTTANIQNLRRWNLMKCLNHDLWRQWRGQAFEVDQVSGGSEDWRCGLSQGL